jgi:putative DNA primase/helicase
MDIKPLEYALIDADDFLQLDIPSKKMILNPWLTEQSINQIFGYRGTGKTWFGLSLFNAITNGESFGPWRTETPLPALYIDGEMASSDIQERFKQLFSGGERITPLYIYSDAYANNLGIPRANLLNRRWREAIQKILTDKGIQLLGLDNISTLAAGIDENSKQAWDPINQWFLNLRFAGISTIFFHHTNKAGEQRGTSGREDNLDTSIALQRPPDYSAEEGAKFIVRFKKARVKTSELKSISDVEFTLTEINGRVVWTWGNVKRKNQFEILKMLDEGISQSDVAKALGIDRSYVNRIKMRALKDGHLSRTGKLTESGYSLINSGSEDEEI